MGFWPVEPGGMVVRTSPPGRTQREPTKDGTFDQASTRAICLYQGEVAPILMVNRDNQLGRQTLEPRRSCRYRRIGSWFLRLRQSDRRGDTLGAGGHRGRDQLAWKRRNAHGRGHRHASLMCAGDAVHRRLFAPGTDEADDPPGAAQGSERQIVLAPGMRAGPAAAQARRWFYLALGKNSCWPSSL